MSTQSSTWLRILMVLVSAFTSWPSASAQTTSVQSTLTVAAPTLVFVVPSTPHPVDKFVDVQVWITAAADLAAFEFDLQFDAGRLTLTSVTLAPALGSSTNCPPSSGRCAVSLGMQSVNTGIAFGAYSYGPGAGISGDHLLATLRFQPTSMTGTTTLSFANALTSTADGTTTTPTTQSASLTLREPGWEIYLPNVTRPATAAVDTVPSSPPSFRTTNLTCPSFVADQQIDSADVTALAASWRQTPQSTGWNAAYDLDGDKRITIADIMIVASAWGQPCDLPLPPDPAAVAPAPDMSITHDVYRGTQFLYTGDNPVQTGVQPGALTPRRVAVLRGRVLDRAGLPSSGVKVTVLHQPELGQTLSRADGVYDLVVNGGGALTLVFTKNGYPPVQRTISPGWQSYAAVDDVVLTPYDSQVTTIDLSASTYQVARGSAVSDKDGARRATVIFPPGTQAMMTLPDGARRVLTSLNVRLTEYTVGERGPAAMPGDLPPTSGYTYAAELTADEVLASGVGRDLLFSQPVVFYVENFMGFAAGTPVPVGFYKGDRAAWEPADDGRVIEIAAIVDGRAQLIVDEGGQVADAAALAALGITDGERAQLAQLYSVGQTLWRVPLDHFSTIDCNWGVLPALGAISPDTPPARSNPQLGCPIKRNGSIIECENQVLGERVDLTGVPFTLNYSSDRVPGRATAYTLQIPLTGADIPPVLKRIELKVVIAGQLYTQTHAALPNQTASVRWDGRDRFGRTLQGQQPALVRIAYVYDGFAARPAGPERNFGFPSGVLIPTVPVRREVELWREQTVTVGAWDARSFGLGGWSLDAHHVYDLIGQILYGGDGSRRFVADSTERVIQTVAGGANISPIPQSGVPALGSPLSSVQIALGADGTLYVGDVWKSLYRIGADGLLVRIAGQPYSQGNGFAGDGGPAIDARFSWIEDMAVGADGSLYIADGFNHRIRRIDASGIVTTVVGSGPVGPGQGAFSGDGGPATSARLNDINGVAVSADGTLYVADTYNYRIRMITPDGRIQTVAGDGTNCPPHALCGDGGPATQAQLNLPRSLGLGPDGSLYVLDGRRVRRIGPDGLITTVAGTGLSCNPNSNPGCEGDGGPALEANLQSPDDLAIGDDGSIYIMDGGKARQVLPNGVIVRVAGTDLFCDVANPVCVNEGGPALQSYLGGAHSLAIGPDNFLYVDPTNRVRRIMPALPGFGLDEIAIPAGDGALLYRFDASGRHLRTEDSMTGATLHTFGYDAAGRLLSITDGDGLQTRVERNQDGVATAIVGPYGQRTALTFGAGGYLSAVSNPAAERLQFGYDSGGLLTAITTPRGHTTTYTFDSAGRLIAAKDANNAIQRLARLESDDDYAVRFSTPLSRTTVYSVETLPNGDLQRVQLSPAGVETRSLIGVDGIHRTSLPSGSWLTVQEDPDPRFGMRAPLNASQTFTTPGGLALNMAMTRTVALSNTAHLLSLTAMTETISVNGRAVRVHYDGASRTYTTATPTGRSAVLKVDMLSRPTLAQFGDLASAVYTYDVQGRLTAVAEGEGGAARTATFTYNNLGYLSTLTDPVGRTASFTYDAAGRLSEQNLPGNRTVSFGYDADGNLTSLTPPGRPAHTFTYSPVGLMTQYTPPDLGPGDESTHYLFNSDRQLTSVQRADGHSVAYGYDSAGRQISTTLERGVIGVEYNPVTGLIDRVSAPDAVLDYVYDGSLLTQIGWQGAVTGTLTYSYDDSLRVAAHQVNALSPVSYTYDADDLLTGAGALTIQRNAVNGLITGTVLGASNDSRSYNVFGEWSSYSARHNASTLLSFTYSRDKLGRITQIVESIDGVSTTSTYSYDSAGRLAEVRRNGTPVGVYTYDANGNRLTVVDDRGAQNASHDAQDRLLSQGATSFTYTAHGDLRTRTTGGQTTTYDYDELGNLLGVDLPSGRAVTYAVDGMNRRIGKRVDGVSERGWLYADALNPIAEVDGNGQVVAEFIYADREHVPASMRKDGNTYRILSDHLGSVRLVVDVVSGVIAQRLDYDAWGRVLTDTNPGFQPFGFAGGLYDPDTGLMRFGARDYDPDMGRWTAKDPIGFAGGDTNPYAYVGGDPVNRFDSTGLWSISIPLNFTAESGAGVTFTPVAFTVTSSGEFGLQGAAGFMGGVQLGASMNSGIIISPDAERLSDLEGDSMTFGVSVIDGIGVALQGSVSNNCARKKINTYGVFLGTGIDNGASLGFEYAWTYASDNLYRDGRTESERQQDMISGLMRQEAIQQMHAWSFY